MDWEDWFQICHPPFDAAGALDRHPGRLPLATARALDLCADLGATGTWFCLGDQARRHPGLVKAIAGAGHRVALHGPTHARAFTLERSAWREGLRQAKASLEDLTGQPVEGYRAPEWSLRGPAAPWLEDLAGLGFRYDSSRAPLVLLGDPAWPRRPHRRADGLWEVPPPVWGRPPLRVPLWGWGLRVLPGAWTRRALLDLAQGDAGTPLVLHPWELDEGQPPLAGAPWGHRFAHGAGLRGFGARLRDLLAGLALCPIEAWLEAR